MTGQEGEAAEGAITEVISSAGDIVGDLITGIPTPIRKNALKAFARLCSTAVEYPLTLINNAMAEREAESRARIKLIDVSADQIAAQLQINPEYARAAATKFAQRIVRERVNIDRIAAIAAVELTSEPSTVTPDSGEAPEAPPISEDWLNAFETEAAQLSSDQMQRLFGKILAGEIKRPKSFSIKTIKLMAHLDNRAATLFHSLCSLSISMHLPTSVDVGILDVRVASLDGNAAANSLQPFGLGFDALNILQEYGLIISDYNSWMDYRPAVVQEGRVSLPAVYQNTKWGFIQKIVAPLTNPFTIHGVGFSQSGKELLPIVDIQPNEQYTVALKNFFDTQGMVMTSVNG
jgi:Protein of unknown function (DUF2806)